MSQDYFLAFIVYLSFSFFALLGLLVASLFISSFRSAYAISKLLGVLLFGYFIWLLSSFHFLDFQNIFLIRTLFALIIGASALWLIKNWPAEWKSKKGENNIAVFLMIEVFWILLYFLYLWLRSHNAEIHGTERFMDMAFFKASSMTNYFPPIDPWRAGFPINYYYYGHYLFSLVSNLSGVAAKYAYTFTLGIIFSSASILSWAFVKRFSNSKIFAPIAAFFLIVSGTIAFGVCIIKTAGLCSYVKSTRLYEPSYIINEIPSYSFTVGDLHAHLIALPFFLITLFFLYELFEKDKISYTFIGIFAVSLASLGMINPWDFVTLAMLVSIVLVFKIFRCKIPDKSWTWVLCKEKICSAKVIVLGFMAIILMLPFLIHFDSGAAGIGFSPTYIAVHSSPANQQYPTPIFGWLGIWGGFVLIFTLSALILKTKLFSTRYFPTLLIIGGFALLLGVELFFVKDIYSLANPPYFRANTVFKFGFHTWTLFALSSMILSAEALRNYGSTKNISRNIRVITWALLLVVFILVVMGLFYPIRAINEFYLSSKLPRTLDGSIFLKTLYPDDYVVIQWMNSNIHSREVLVEAAGESYSDYGRIGIFTGMTNPVNWLSHEWGWRFKPEFSSKEKPDGQVESGWNKIATASGEVRQIYESRDINTTKAILKKYNVKYVYIGDLERKMYPFILAQKFNDLGKVVFSSSNSLLYELDI